MISSIDIVVCPRLSLASKEWGMSLPVAKAVCMFRGILLSGWKVQ